ncbi:hypothetical protein GCM10022225_10110 [Plantactinospora mayteni]|uniref:DUF1579 domain-containing protein n=1 Tax=Plantactinospora mayteni TaxID=566021 RepID=A0ABQ4EHM1_9ACTN|nr:hypothetical protein [Plantactinospora mayteni]GIG94240.1 hypothetical protein Pma05_08130 [Plantactinospora mayteni]
MRNTDFDFLAGHWTSRQRRLVKVLSGVDEWYEFDATLDCQVLLDGSGVFDVLRAPERDIEGITLRLFNPEERVWRIWWAAKTSGGQLDVPVVGRFTDGVGVFECDDTWEGRPIRVRYTWSGADTGQPRWEQAFSPDGGRTWEVNWVATFRRD